MSGVADRTYDPKKLIVIFGGIEITGFSEDSMVEIEPQGEGWTAYDGAQGEHSRSRDPNDTQLATITLAHTSKSNSELRRIWDLDRLTGKGVLPFIMKDLSGKAVVVSDEAYIQQAPAVSRKRAINDQEWTILLVSPVISE